MSFFEKYLTVWVLACIGLGVAAGSLFPAAFQSLGLLEIANINLPMAVLIWLMIVPMLIKIDIGSLGRFSRYSKGIGVTLLVNWGIKPFSMALLACLFVGHLFRPYLPAEQIDSYISGLIILAAAPCTAMVFVWSHLTDGDSHFTLTQVALNDLIMIFAFAPVVGLLLGLSSIAVPWDTLFLSVLLYIAIPLVIANLWRKHLLRAGGHSALNLWIKRAQPLSILALLVTLVLIFGFQGTQIINRPMVIMLLSVPILIQVLLNSSLAYLLNRLVGSPHCVAAPSALIGSSNFL